MRRALVWSVSLVLAIATSSAAQPAARRVLIINSLDTGFAIEAAFTREFRAELSGQFQEPITFFQVSVQPTPSTVAIQEDVVADYLRASLAGQRLDLVVAISASAVMFARRHSLQLFPDTPVLLAVDPRWLRQEVLTPHEVVAPFAVSPIRVVNDMLRLTPQVKNLFVVIGSSRFEQAWAGEMRSDFQPLADRLNISWSDGLSFAETLQRAAALPANSAVLYAILSVDAKGLSHSEVRVIQELHEVANAPLYGLFSNQLGRGSSVAR